MSFLRYLKENLRLLGFYAVLMLFITGILVFDKKSVRMDLNITYLIAISTLFFMIYILSDYYIKLQQIKKLLAVKDSNDKTPIMPEPVDYKDEVYCSIISDLYDSSVNSMRDIEGKFNENVEFMTAWVHEIKTPITTANLILNDKLDRESLKEEMDKIDEYVEKVLYYTRSENFTKDYIVSDISINKMVKESIKKHSLMFIKKHLKVVCDISDYFTVETDKKWMLFILDQLVSNAVKYTDIGGTITFYVSENDDEKTLTVQDTGIGIKEEDMNRIFSEAFTGFNGRNKNSKSTGMGLYLAQKLSKKLGHHITAESEFGKGTKMVVHFPKWDDYYNITKV